MSKLNSHKRIPKNTKEIAKDKINTMMNFAMSYAKSYTPNALYPPYKRKVDNIYPRNSDEPLNPAEMEYLRDFAITHSEKLSKIADYLYQNLKSGLSGLYKNKNYVKNTIQAVDTLLVALNDAQLNIYTSNYLKIVQKLLDQSDFFFKELATQSFKKFCVKSANFVAANHYQSLDMCVNKLCSLCNCTERDEKYRLCALQCLRDLYIHLVPEESALAPFFWENIDWVITILLSILNGTEATESEMREVAMDFFVDIVARVNYTTIAKVLEPVFVFFDEKKWENEAFIASVFKAIMDNLNEMQANAIKQLIIHLESERHADTKVRIRVTRTANVYLPRGRLQYWFFIDIVPILMRCLAANIERYYSIDAKTRADEEVLQSELMNLMRNLADLIPDYAKIEIAALIVNDLSVSRWVDAISVPRDQRRLSALIRDKYLDVLYEICSKYEAKEVFRAFNNEDLLKNLLLLSLRSAAGARRKINEIIHFLMDKNGNLVRLNETSGGVFARDMRVSREDAFFMRKNGWFVLAHLSEALFLEDNLRDNFEAVFVTLTLMATGVNDEEFLADFVLFGLHVQEMALANYQYLSFFSACEIMSFLTAYFEVLMSVCRIEELKNYLGTVVELRRRDALFSKFLDSQFTCSKENRKTVETSVGENGIFERELKNAAQCFAAVQKAKKDIDEAEANLGAFKWLFKRKILFDMLRKNNCVISEQNFSLSVEKLRKMDLGNSLVKYRCLTYINDKSKDVDLEISLAEAVAAGASEDTISLDSIGIEMGSDDVLEESFDIIKNILDDTPPAEESSKRRDLGVFREKTFGDIQMMLEKDRGVQICEENYLRVLDFVANELTSSDDLSSCVKRDELSEIELPAFLVRCMVSGSCTSLLVSFERSS